MSQEPALTERFEACATTSARWRSGCWGRSTKPTTPSSRRGSGPTGRICPTVENLGGWLTTVTARVCLDMLRARHRRAEHPLPPTADTVPGRIASTAAPAGGGRSPEDQAVMAESVGLALLVVLDRLSPAQRVAFVLHDLFAVPFEQIAEVVDRSTVATKKLASRARERVRGQRRGRPTRPTGWSTVPSCRRSWPRPATATSTRCCTCSLRTWCAVPTRRRSRRHCGRGPRRSDGRRGDQGIRRPRPPGRGRARRRRSRHRRRPGRSPALPPPRDDHGRAHHRAFEVIADVAGLATVSLAAFSDPNGGLPGETDASDDETPFTPW